MESSSQQPRHRGETLAAISTGLVQLHSRFYGKGPTKAKTHLLDDTVICLLREGFTTVEQTLLEAGNAEAVHQIRRNFQGAMQDAFTEVVEDATGREVIAYMSQIHTDPDIAVEVFVLKPSDEPDAGDGEADPVLENEAPGASEAETPGDLD